MGTSVFFHSEGKSEVWAELPCNRLPILCETSWKGDRWDTLWPKRNFNLCGRPVQGKATIFSKSACRLSMPYLISVRGWYDCTCEMVSWTSLFFFKVDVKNVNFCYYRFYFLTNVSVYWEQTMECWKAGFRRCSGHNWGDFQWAFSTYLAFYRRGSMKESEQKDWKLK